MFENESSVEVCFGVINPPDTEEFGLLLDLVPVTVDGTAIGKSKLVPFELYTQKHVQCINNTFLVVSGGGGTFNDFTHLTLSTAFRTLEGNNRRDCVNVVINSDNRYEGTETFSVLLEFDELLSQVVRDQVILQPSVVYVDILDVTRE